MFKKLGFMCAIGALCALATPATHAGEDTATDDRLLPDWMSVSANATFASGFVGNGITWVDGPVMMSSATVGVTYDGLTLSGTFWSVVNLNDVVGYDNPTPDEYQMTEYDAIIDLTYSNFEHLDISLGFIHYEFNKLGGAGSETGDVYGALAFKTIPLSPVVTVYYDVDGTNSGWHGTVAVSHTFTVKDVSFDTYGGFGLTDDDYGAAYFSDDGKDYSGFSHWWVGVSKTFELNSHFSVTPSLSYYRLVNDNGTLGASFDSLQAAGFSGDEDAIVAAVAIDFSL